MITDGKYKPLSYRHEYGLRSQEAREAMAKMIRFVGGMSRLIAELEERRDRASYEAVRREAKQLVKLSKDVLKALPAHPVRERNKFFRMDRNGPVT